MPIRKRKTILNARPRPRPHPRPPATPSRIRGYFKEIINRAFALDAKRHGRYPSLGSLERALRLIWDVLLLVDNVVSSTLSYRLRSLTYRETPSPTGEL